MWPQRGQVSVDVTRMCDDNWRVIALHRGAVHVTDVKFQGKDTAYVNFGSQVTAILKDIGIRKPDMLQLVADGQQL
jgi:endonuclease G